MSTLKVGDIKHESFTGTTQLKLDSAGRVLVGTDTKGQADADDFTVATSGAGGITIRTGNSNNANIFFSDATSGSAEYAGYLQYKHDSDRLDFGTATSTRMTIDSSGRIGIGETSPFSKLHIKTADTGASAVSGDANEFVIENTGNCGMTLQSANDGVGNIFFGDVANGSVGRVSYNHGSNFMYFQTNAAERMRIDSSGRLIIGASSNISTGGIEGALEVIGTGSDDASVNLARFSNDVHPSFLCFSKSRNSSNGSNTVVQDGDRLGVIAFFGDDGSDYSSQAAEIECEVNGTPGSNDMPGRLIFKTTTDGGSSPTETMRLGRSGTHAQVFMNTTSQFNTSVLSLATNGSNGLGIRTGATNSQSHVSFQSPNGVHGTITTNGANTQYNTSSDYRLKENVTTLSDGITRIKNLLPKRFNFILKPDLTQDGFLAHEVSSVVPEAVSGDKDAVDSNGDVVSQQFDPSKLVPLLVAALQEAIVRIEALEAG